ncbi:hypothetical protein Aduo_013499 [Ancylostoma duodenale]
MLKPVILTSFSLIFSHLWRSILLLLFVIQQFSSECISNEFDEDDDLSFLNASLVCGKLFPVLHACNFNTLYSIPEWEDYYPIIPIRWPENLTCYKHVGGYASETPVLCVCNGANCNNEKDLVSALGHIEQETVNGKLLHEQELHRLGNCLIKRIISSKSEDEESTGKVPDIQMDANHPLLSWHKRIISDDSTMKAPASRDFNVDFVMLLVLIYILAVTILYALLLSFRIRKLRPCVITQCK